MSVPLILAIQPDRRQASQLASIVRGMSAELVLMESAERAMAVLGERLPDLILTPALLSHKDESALTERLREFGDAAAHIQTLTIPILETAAAPARKGVLSALRKPKRKGKAGAAEPIGCTADTFAEQIAIYLKRAIEARGTHPRLHAQVAASASAPEPQPEPDVPPHHDRPAEGGGLPTIEELSARTPAVPEPDGSLETSMAAIVAMVPVAGATANEQLVPMPVVKSRVAELPIELPSAETVASTEEAVPAVPAPPASAVEMSMAAVAAMVPVAGAAAGADARPVPMPAVIPHVAELAMELPSTETAAAMDEAVRAMPLPPTGAVEMGMAAVAAMVPVVSAAAVADRPVPMPEVTPHVAELPMELPSAEMAAVVSRNVPVVPDSAGSVEMNMAAIAAMVRVVGSGAVADDRPVPMPAVIPRVANLPVGLLSVDMTAPAREVMPLVPESARAVDMSVQIVAGIVPLVGAHADERHVLRPPTPMLQVSELGMVLPSTARTASADDGVLVPAPPSILAETSIDAVAAMMPGLVVAETNRPVSMPPVMARVVELPIELPSADTLASMDRAVPVMATPPAGSREMSMAALAAIVPLINAAVHSRPVPMPVAMAHVVELPLELPSAQAAVFANEGVVAVPAPSAGSVESRVEAVTPHISKAGKKKKRLQARKAAGKKIPKREDALSNPFDPDQCRFSALLAKLDEVAGHADQSQPSASRAGREAHGEKGKTPTKPR